MTCSSNVAIRLEVSGEVWGVSQTGDTSLILREARTAPAGSGTLAITVDGRERTWPIQYEAISGRVVRYREAKHN